MGRGRAWLNLALVVALLPVFFGDARGASMANEWQLLNTPGAELIIRADPRVSPTYIAPPAREPVVRAQAAQITVDYQNFPPDAQASFQNAINIWQGLLNAPIPIRVRAVWGPLPEGVLGGARASAFLRNTATNTLYPVALGQQLAGVDPNPSGYDIEATFNSNGVSWYFGNGQAPSNQYNLTTVVLHELAHGLGFSDTFDVQGGVGGYGIDGLPVIFDRFVVNSDGIALTDTARYPNPSTALAGQIQSNALYFGGPKARAANGGAPPRLYAPNPFEQGSSVAHFDEETYAAGSPNALMTPALARGESVYNPGSFTLGVFGDLGWSVAAAPAPTPSPSASPSPTPSPSASPSPSPSASPSASPTPAPSASPTPAPSASPTPAPSASPTPRPSASPVPSPSPIPSPPPTGNGGFLPGLPNTGGGGGGDGGAGSTPGWLALVPFLALGAGLFLRRRLRRAA